MIFTGLSWWFMNLSQHPYIEGPEGVKWELGFAYFRTGKWDLLHWDWDLATRTGKKVVYNGMGKMSCGVYRSLETLVKFLNALKNVTKQSLGRPKNVNYRPNQQMSNQRSRDLILALT